MAEAPLAATPPSPPVGAPTFPAGPSVKGWDDVVATTVKWVATVPQKKRDKIVSKKYEEKGYDMQAMAIQKYYDLFTKDYPEQTDAHRLEISTAMGFIYFVNQVLRITIEDKVTVDKGNVTRVSKIGRSDKEENDVEMK
jgi:hypothetical protein